MIKRNKLNVLVTGGLGILGNELIYLLTKEKNLQIFIIDHNKKKMRLKNSKFDKKKINFINGDFRNYKKIKNIIFKKKINIIFHLGAVTQVIDAYKSPIKTFDTNIFGTINILETVRQLNKKIIIIYSSSDKAYGKLLDRSYLENHPLHGDFPYDVSKSASDLIAQSYSKTYNLRIGIIRSGNLYGPGDYNLERLIPGLIVNSLKNKKTIIRSDGKLIRDYIYVKDAAKAYLKLMKKMIVSKKRLHIYNIGSNINMSVMEIVKRILFLLKKNLKPIIKNNSKIEIKKQKLNYNKAKSHLNWFPDSNLNKSLIETIDWYKKNKNYFKY